jgi:hypothetical protein
VQQHPAEARHGVSPRVWQEDHGDGGIVEASFRAKVLLAVALEVVVAPALVDTAA